jgi:fatty-acyl-CoA synthase
MHVVDMILFWAKNAPQRPAVIEPGMIVTFRSLAEAMATVAQKAAQLELDRNEPVAVSIANPVKQMAVVLGLLHAEYTVAPIFGGTRMNHLRDAGIRNLITDGPGQVISGGRNIQFTDAWLPTADTPPTAALRTARAGALKNGRMIFFTSGTTGRPKTIVMTKEAHIARMGLSTLYDTLAHSKVLVAPGLSTVYGWNRTCSVLRAGKTACFALPGQPMLWAVSLFQIEVVVASTYQALGLANLQHDLQYELGSLKAVSVGGASVSETLVRRIQANLCRNVFIEYGSTEAGLAAVGSYETIGHVADAVGFVTPWTDLEIVDESDRPLPTGAEGRIRYRTPFFALDQQDDGKWFYPGDKGRLTADRILSITGRDDDVLNRGGEKVSATLIEDQLRSAVGVDDVAVCGVTNDDGIQEIWAAIVPKTTLDLAAFRTYVKEANICRTRIDSFFAVDRIPRTELGKIRRNDLKETLLGLPRP